MLIGQNKQWEQNNVLYFLKFVTYLLLSRPYIPFLFLSKSVSFIWKLFFIFTFQSSNYTSLKFEENENKNI